MLYKDDKCKRRQRKQFSTLQFFLMCRQSTAVLQGKVIVSIHSSLNKMPDRVAAGVHTFSLSLPALLHRERQELPLLQAKYHTTYRRPYASLHYIRFFKISLYTYSFVHNLNTQKSHTLQTIFSKQDVP